MPIARKLKSAAGLAALIALAGCQAMGPPPATRVPVAAAPSGVEGDWVSTDGVALSRFSTGIFETLATDTGNKLAEGSYSYVDQNNVSISVTSLIRQTTTQVNCSMVTTTQLNCTSSAGQQFSLTRRTGMS